MTFFGMSRARTPLLHVVEHWKWGKSFKFPQERNTSPGAHPTSGSRQQAFERFPGASNLSPVFELIGLGHEIVVEILGSALPFPFSEKRFQTFPSNQPLTATQ
jgi:hypothetical protein